VNATLFSTTHFQLAMGRATISITYDAEKPKISPLLFKFSVTRWTPMTNSKGPPAGRELTVGSA
jgi:hypothetical protein